MPAPQPGDLLPVSPSGGLKPCDVNIDDIQNHCWNWLRSRCSGSAGNYCPGYAYHEDRRKYDQQPW